MDGEEKVSCSGLACLLTATIWLHLLRSRAGAFHITAGLGGECGLTFGESKPCLPSASHLSQGTGGLHLAAQMRCAFSSFPKHRSSSSIRKIMLTRHLRSARCHLHKKKEKKKKKYLLDLRMNKLQLRLTSRCMNHFCRWAANTRFCTV